MSRRKGSKLTHGGRREGAGRPRVGNIKKMWMIEPTIVAQILQIAERAGQTQSAVANALLAQALAR